MRHPPTMITVMALEWVTDIGPIGGASHHVPLNFSSESNIEVNILEWEATCDQNTAAILVLEAPYTIKHSDFV